MQPSLGSSNTTHLRQTWQQDLTTLQDKGKVCGSCGGTGLGALVSRHVLPCCCAGTLQSLQSQWSFGSKTTAVKTSLHGLLNALTQSMV